MPDTPTIWETLSHYRAVIIGGVLVVVVLILWARKTGRDCWFCFGHGTLSLDALTSDEQEAIEQVYRASLEEYDRGDIRACRRCGAVGPYIHHHMRFAHPLSRPHQEVWATPCLHCGSRALIEGEQAQCERCGARHGFVEEGPFRIWTVRKGT